MVLVIGRYRLPQPTNKEMSMVAEITYTAGKTYRIKGVKFERGIPKKVASNAVIRRCQQTSGFNVRVLEDRRTTKIVREPIPTKRTVPKASKKTSDKKDKK